MDKIHYCHSTKFEVIGVMADMIKEFTEIVQMIRSEEDPVERFFFYVGLCMAFPVILLLILAEYIWAGIQSWR